MKRSLVMFVAGASSLCVGLGVASASNDTPMHSACTGACATYWPPQLTHGRPVALRGAKSSLLGTIRRGDGTTQVTYSGHPLYLYVGDARAGRVTGEGSQTFGAGWDALTRGGKKIEKDGNS